MKSSKKNMKGFTLVELLVVISIIALLLAVLIPSLSKAKAVANRMICGDYIKDIDAVNVACTNQDRYAYCLSFRPKLTMEIGSSSQYYDDEPRGTNRVFREKLKLDSYSKDKRHMLTPAALYNFPYNMPKAFLSPPIKISIDQTANNKNINKFVITHWRMANFNIASEDAMPFASATTLPLNFSFGLVKERGGGSDAART
jgi:prepilin-type N-terminal cleavage/methylation domain-containing protein